MFSLLRLTVVVAAALLLLLLPGNVRSGAGAHAAGATAHLVGSVRKPITPNTAAKPSKPKAKPRRPVAVDPALPNDPLWRDSWSLTKVGAPQPGA